MMHFCTPTLPVADSSKVQRSNSERRDAKPSSSKVSSEEPSEQKSSNALAVQPASQSEESIPYVPIGVTRVGGLG